MRVDIIQADYDKLEQIANRFRQQTDETQHLIHTVQQSMGLLEQGWEGQAANKFFQEMHQELLPACQRLAKTLNISSQTILNISDLLRQAEEEAASPFRERADILGILGDANNNTGQVGNDQAKRFNWWDFGGDISSGTSNIINYASNVRYRDFKSIGRFINQLVGNKRAGWVGRMDDLGHMLKSPLVQKLGKGLEGLSLFAGIGEDRAAGFSWEKAIITETAELVTTGLLRKGLYAVPYVGQAMMIYDGALLLGNLAAGGLQSLGFEGAATSLQNFVDAVDVDQYIGKGYDWVYDKAAPVVQDVAQEVSKFSAGLIEDAKDVVGGTINNISQGISSLFGG